MMAKMGAIVTGLEPARGLINHATAREQKEKLGITYLCDDLSKWHEKQNFFDIVVANMVLMDIPDYKSAIQNCVAALKKGGLFIFSISHPCFDVEEGWKEEEPYVQVKNYFDEYKIQNYIGYSFHHTLSTYVNILSDFGCCINKMLEPRLPLEVVNQNKKYERDKHVPNFLIIKCIKSK
jgi:SAM-dependent methyltransferase